jgi:hypothetical protein
MEESFMLFRLDIRLIPFVQHPSHTTLVLMMDFTVSEMFKLIRFCLMWIYLMIHSFLRMVNTWVCFIFKFESHQHLMKLWNVQLIWMPRHGRIRQSESAEQFAIPGSAHTYVGSEPVCTAQKGFLRGQSGSGCTENMRNTGISHV